MFRYIRHILITFILLLCFTGANSQILISLLLGDKLNSGKVEFGLDGGVTFSNLTGIDGANYAAGFNLGFYFDIRLKNKLRLHTGVIVRSPLGAKGIPVYSTGDTALDHLMKYGSVRKNLRYFHVPVLLKYANPHFYAEGGFQLGLINDAFDEFTASIHDKNDLTYTKKNQKHYHPIDAGLTAGVGWKILQNMGMYISFRYYYGLIDITPDDSGKNNYHRAFYLTAGIPIGAEKAKKKAAEKAGQEIK